MNTNANVRGKRTARIRGWSEMDGGGGKVTVLITNQPRQVDFVNK